MDQFFELSDLSDEEIGSKLIEAFRKAKKEYEKRQVVFACAACGKAIIKDSIEHDNCHTSDGKNWFCQDCNYKIEKRKIYKCASCPKRENEWNLRLLMNPFTGEEKWQCFGCHGKNVKIENFVTL